MLTFLQQFLLDYRNSNYKCQIRNTGKLDRESLVVFFSSDPRFKSCREFYAGAIYHRSTNQTDIKNEDKKWTDNWVTFYLQKTIV